MPKIGQLSLTLTLVYHDQLEIQTVPLLVLFSGMQMCVCSGVLTCVGHSCNGIIQLCKQDKTFAVSTLKK